MAKYPKELSDLAYASDLRPGEAFLESDENYDLLHFDRIDFVDEAATGVTFMECAFTGGSIEGGNLRGAGFVDTWMQEVRLVGPDMARTRWRDATLVGGIAAGVQMFDSGLERVVFSGCKLDSVNFRNASLTEVVFEDCMLRDVDFGGAKLTKVTFPGSNLSGVDFTQAKLKKVDLRGAQLGIKAGYDALRGVTIDGMQLMEIAPMLAAEMGIVVKE